MPRPRPESTVLQQRARSHLTGRPALCCLVLLPVLAAAQAPDPIAEPGAAQEQGETVRVRVDGVHRLPDYAAVTRLLQGAPGVRRANMVAVDQGHVTFEVVVRGGAAGLPEALTAVAGLVPEPGSATPAYRYQPSAT